MYRSYIIIRFDNKYNQNRYWHRSLNVKKLLAVKFSHLGRNMTMQRMQKLYRLPEVWNDISRNNKIGFVFIKQETQVKGFRAMRESDIPRAFALLTQVNKQNSFIFSKDYFQYLKKFDLSPVFTQEEFEYLCQNRPNIVSSFVVEVNFTKIRIKKTYFLFSFI